MDKRGASPKEGGFAQRGGLRPLLRVRKVGREGMVRKRFRFTGRVQGVGFRTRAKYAARGMCITGWVRNDADGSVVMEAQGAEKAIDQMMIMINRSDYIMIDSIESETIPPVEDENSFTALY